ncbi:MAG: hypothetical protein HOE11_04000 [Candidatus Diapherotrites archaeon]|nr:hypothetical protein [Candidatus Diapherotrites archaeon]
MEEKAQVNISVLLLLVAAIVIVTTVALFVKNAADTAGDTVIATIENTNP